MERCQDEAPKCSVSLAMPDSAPGAEKDVALTGGKPNSIRVTSGGPEDATVRVG